MKVIGFIASPRKEGNTAWIINKILEGSKEQGAETQSWHTSDLDIKPCRSHEGYRFVIGFGTIPGIMRMLHMRNWLTACVAIFRYMKSIFTTDELQRGVYYVREKMCCREETDMKKILRTLLAIVAILMVCTAPCHADRGWHGGGYGWHGGGWGWGWGGPILGAEVLGLGLIEMSYPYAYPYPAPVIQQPAPEMYVQPSPQPVQTGYWYYCSDSRTYYPYVRECPGGWMKVVPTPPPR